MYRVYSGPPGSERLNPLEKGRHLFKEFGTMDEAMGFAQHLKTTGRVALLLEGDDGTLDIRAEMMADEREPGHGDPP